MRIRVLWPGRTKSAPVRELEAFYVKRIRGLAPIEIVETATSRGVGERESARILEIEARGLEKRLDNDYIVCLFDRGQEMDSNEFARFLGGRTSTGGRPTAFIAGGFLGLSVRILERADVRLSLSRMTHSHDLCRAILLEQIYRGLSLAKGRSYAK